MWKILTGVVIAAMLMAAACVRPWFQVEQYPNIARFDAPAVYQTWWDQMESCTGRKGNMRHVSFYVVQANRVEGDRGFRMEGLADSLLGFYDVGAHRIYVTQPGMFTPWLVSHEMVHALGIMGHPDSIFRVACGVMP